MLARVDAVLRPARGPMVRSSRKVSSAGSAPARSSTASLVDSSTVKLPVMMPEPPGMCALDHRGRDHLVVQHDGEGLADVARPCSRRTCARPAGLKRKLTAGRPFWSKAGCASVSSSPVTTGVGSSDVVDALLVHATAASRCPARGRRRRSTCGRRPGWKVSSRGGADQLLQLLGRADAGHLDQDAVVALALDRGLARADLVDRGGG